MTELVEEWNKNFIHCTWRKHEQFGNTVKGANCQIEDVGVLLVGEVLCSLQLRNKWKRNLT